MDKSKKTSATTKSQALKNDKNPVSQAKYKITAGTSQYVNEVAEHYKTSKFIVTRGGKSSEYNIKSGFGYYILPFKKKSNIFKVAEVVETGIRMKELEPMFRFLEFKDKDIAKAASVSTRTVSRWNSETIIASQSLTNFFKIDELIRKGVELFGNETEFKKWLSIPNLALGNVAPADLITTSLGVEIIEDAIEALNYGTVL